jgi:hypothetical protein
MTVEEYDRRIDAGEKMWVKDETNGMSFRWTGWKRRYDPRLMTSSDPDIQLDPIDDTLVGQWVAGNPQIMYYASVPGKEGISRRGDVLNIESAPEQAVLTTSSSQDLLDHCRKECLQRLTVMMEKLGAIDGPNFRPVS